MKPKDSNNQSDKQTNANKKRVWGKDILYPNVNV